MKPNSRCRPATAGRGCVSFRREKFVPFGGPDGGDGGLGGSVYLKAVEGMNTLADFRISRTYKGQNGESGSGNDCTGHGGDDTYVSIPIGTVVIDKDTGETLGDLLTVEGQTLLACQRRQGAAGATPALNPAPIAPRASPVSGCRARSASSQLELEIDLPMVGLAGPAQCRQIDADSGRFGRDGPRLPITPSPPCIRTWAWCRWGWAAVSSWRTSPD